MARLPRGRRGLDPMATGAPALHVALEVQEALEALRLPRLQRARRAPPAAAVDDDVATARGREFAEPRGPVRFIG